MSRTKLAIAIVLVVALSILLASVVNAVPRETVTMCNPSTKNEVEVHTDQVQHKLGQGWTYPPCEEEQGPVETQEPGPVETQEPGPVETQEPGPVETEEPGPVETEEPEQCAEGTVWNGESCVPTQGGGQPQISVTTSITEPAAQPQSCLDVFGPFIPSGTEPILSMTGSAVLSWAPYTESLLLTIVSIDDGVRPGNFSGILCVDGIDAPTGTWIVVKANDQVVAFVQVVENGGSLLFVSQPIIVNANQSPDPLNTAWLLPLEALPQP